MSADLDEEDNQPEDVARRARDAENDEFQFARYLANWTTPFEQGPSKVVRVGGYSDGSNLQDDVLTFQQFNQGHLYRNWEEVAIDVCKQFREKPEAWCGGSICDECVYDWRVYGFADKRSPDRDGRTRLLTLADKDLFFVIVGSGNLDPEVFVLHSDPLLQWLVRVRGFELSS